MSSHSNHNKTKSTSKHRGISPFRFRGSATTATGHHRGISPFHNVISKSKSRSFDSQDSRGGGDSTKTKGSNAVVVCHQTANSIVFRDHLRRTAKLIVEEEEGIKEEEDDDSDDSSSSIGSEEDSEIRRSLRSSLRQSIRDSIRLDRESIPLISQEINAMAQSMVPEEFQDIKLRVPYCTEKHVEIEGFHTLVNPLPPLELGTKSEFQPLLLEDEGKNGEISKDWTEAEREVFQMLKHQKACVKTIKNNEWPTFLKRFLTPEPKKNNHLPSQHDDIVPHLPDFSLNSFVTSTSLLPTLGKKMRCYGSQTAYTIGVVFALPEFESSKAEDEEAQRTKTWSWPAGYAAKTEFNIDNRGRLINGREQALTPFSTMRQYNDEYVHKKQDHMIAGKRIKDGFKVVPYNEVYVRVGGLPRLVGGKDSGTGEKVEQRRSLDRGVGLPVALFIRSATMGDIVSLLRTRARIAKNANLGEKYVKAMPLLLINNELGVRVFTETLQNAFWKVAANKLNPFQNPILEPMTQIHNTHEQYLKQKLEELIHLDETSRTHLTLDECARISGGWGITDDSLTSILAEAMVQEDGSKLSSESVGNVALEGLASAIRSGDYYIARQILILFSVVASELSVEEKIVEALKKDGLGVAATYSDDSLLQRKSSDTNSRSETASSLPIDTKHLRSTTNSDGLLEVLGAAQVLKSMKDGSAKRRAAESVKAVDEWVKYGEESVAFRLSSWRSQRADEDDSHIAIVDNSKFMAFVSNKAITNRKKFAGQLRKAVEHSDIANIRFLQTVFEIVHNMHSPCLRLELIQFMLGLDNRFSVSLVKRSIELAATCMSVVTTIRK